MMRKIGLVILAVFLTVILLNVWMIPIAFVVQVIAGLDGPAVFRSEYALALMLAFVSSVLIVRPLWKPKPKVARSLEPQQHKHP